MGMIDNDWLPALRPEFAKPYYKDLFDFVKAEYSRKSLFIRRLMIFLTHFILHRCQKLKLLYSGRILTTM